MLIFSFHENFMKFHLKKMIYESSFILYDEKTITSQS
jgi:hypothetical protein